MDDEEDDKGDAKDTRLTLMEEVLLLGLKDREVAVRFPQVIVASMLQGRRREPRKTKTHWPGDFLKSYFVFYGGFYVIVQSMTRNNAD